ncbi:MBL fold metallo-hydrolase [Desulfotruncus alcoholivorax]|uniref:MBL fold metallo-hydrolase n=1 Tax=Desulfotruncus alcoholivorax TaxID=265477 RepID=UPI001EE55CEB|nr:MBL fold metallo-hydrolase [Desulfotruncus alcoholivorax]
MTYNLGDEILLKTAHNNHPGECLSYRIEHAGRSCCYVTDTEHYSVIDHHLSKFIKGSDIVIYDANFTDEEYNGYSGFDPKTGWGHSTWQEGIKLVQEAGAKKLVLFHHATHRTDAELDQIEIKAQAKYPDCIAAKEGMVLYI